MEFWIYYFMIIACFIGFIVAIMETLFDHDLIMKVMRIGQGLVFAIAGTIISGLL